MACVRPSKSAIISTVTVESSPLDSDRQCRDSGDGYKSSKYKGPSSLLLKRRQQLQPLGGYLNPYRSTGDFGNHLFPRNSSSKTNLNKITQKVMSAKVLKVKQLQNELTEMQFQLNELVTENRILKTMLKKQELALRKYEGKNAELPQLMHSHDEEVRILIAKVKHLKMSMFEKDRRLKEQDTKLLRLTEQNEHLLKLSKDRNLGEREHLANKVEELQETIQEQDSTIQMLKRKMMLEMKTSRQHMAQEQTQCRKLQSSLKEAVETNTRLEALVQRKDRYINNIQPKRTIPGLQSLASNSKQPSKVHVEVYPQGRSLLDEENEGDLDDLSAATYTESNSPLSTNASSLGTAELASQPGLIAARRFTMSQPVREALYPQSQRALVDRPGGTSPSQAESVTSSPERNGSLPSLGLKLQTESPNRPKAFSMFTLISDFKKEASSRPTSYRAVEADGRDSPRREQSVSTSPGSPINGVHDGYVATSPGNIVRDQDEPSTGVRNEYREIGADNASIAGDSREDKLQLDGASNTKSRLQPAELTTTVRNSGLSKQQLDGTPNTGTRLQPAELTTTVRSSGLGKQQLDGTPNTGSRVEVMGKLLPAEVTTSVGSSGLGKRQHSGISKVEINWRATDVPQPTDMANMAGNVETVSPGVTNQSRPVEMPTISGPPGAIGKLGTDPVEVVDQPRPAEVTPMSVASEPWVSEVEESSKAETAAIPEPTIDPLRKTRLLRALRAIDDGDIRAMSRPPKQGKNRQLFAEMRDKRREDNATKPLDKNKFMMELFEKELT